MSTVDRPFWFGGTGSDWMLVALGSPRPRMMERGSVLQPIILENRPKFGLFREEPDLTCLHKPNTMDALAGRYRGCGRSTAPRSGMAGKNERRNAPLNGEGILGDDR